MARKTKPVYVNLAVAKYLGINVKTLQELQAHFAKSDIIDFCKPLPAAQRNLIKKYGEGIIFNNYDIDLAYASCATCCGATELTYLEDLEPYSWLYFNPDLEFSPGKLYIYYGVDTNIINLLRCWGFEEVNKFHNMNTGNLVHVLHYYRSNK